MKCCAWLALSKEWIAPSAASDQNQVYSWQIIDFIDCVDQWIYNFLNMKPELCLSTSRDCWTHYQFKASIRSQSHTFQHFHRLTAGSFSNKTELLANPETLRCLSWNPFTCLRFEILNVWQWEVAAAFSYFRQRPQWVSKARERGSSVHLCQIEGPKS